MYHTLFEIEDCKKNIHVFPSSKLKNAPAYPACIYCGETAIEWDITRQRNLNNIEFLTSELHKCKERNKAWNLEVDLKAKNHALRKGRLEFKDYAKKRLVQMIGRVYDLGGPLKRPYRDGFQTPFSGNMVYYAQHATACCCRPCVARWHGIPQGADLTDDELNYLAEVVMVYINYKLPELRDEGIYIPPIRTGKAAIQKPKRGTDAIQMQLISS